MIFLYWNVFLKNHQGLFIDIQVLLCALIPVYLWWRIKRGIWDLKFAFRHMILQNETQVHEDLLGQHKEVMWCDGVKSERGRPELWPSSVSLFRKVAQPLSHSHAFIYFYVACFLMISFEQRLLLLLKGRVKNYSIATALPVWMIYSSIRNLERARFIQSGLDHSKQWDVQSQVLSTRTSTKEVLNLPASFTFSLSHLLHASLPSL